MLNRVGEYAYHLSDAVQCITNQLMLQTVDQVGQEDVVHGQLSGELTDSATAKQISNLEHL